MPCTALMIPIALIAIEFTGHQSRGRHASPASPADPSQRAWYRLVARERFRVPVNLVPGRCQLPDSLCLSHVKARLGVCAAVHPSAQLGSGLARSVQSRHA